MKLYNLIKDPFAMYLPENCSYCTRKEIDELHQSTCKKLGIDEIYPDILWSFSSTLRHCLAEAVYWRDLDDKMQWRIHYGIKTWIPMGSENRKNTIVHEVCHLAVEKIYGHKKRVKKGEEPVTDHGPHWQELMRKCGEDPFVEYQWRYR